MMGIRMPKTWWAVFKRQTIKLRDWCIWLVDLFEVINLLEFKFVQSVRSDDRCSDVVNFNPMCR
jgi:hypothetical protein